MAASNDSLINEATSLGSDWVSEAIPLTHLAHYAIQLFFSGTPSGNFSLQYSNGTEQDSLQWSPIAGSSQVISEAGDHTWAVQNAGYKWVRVVWDYSSGNGMLNYARFNSKG